MKSWVVFFLFSAVLLWIPMAQADVADREVDPVLFQYFHDVDTRDGSRRELVNVERDGTIYSYLSTPDGVFKKRLGRLGDKKFPIPAGGGIIGKAGNAYVWSNGDLYACSRPGDDCSDQRIGHIDLPLKVVEKQTPVTPTKELLVSEKLKQCEQRLSQAQDLVEILRGTATTAQSKKLFQRLDKALSGASSAEQSASGTAAH